MLRKHCTKTFFPFPLCSDHDWATRLSLIRGALMALSVYLWYMLVRTFKVTLEFQVGYIGYVHMHTLKDVKDFL